MAQICIRVEDDVKAQAEEVCNELGLSLSAAINIYLKKLGREKRIPFDLSVDTERSVGTAARRVRKDSQEEGQCAEGTFELIND